MTTAPDKSTNPSVNTAAEERSRRRLPPTPPHMIATGHEGSVRDQIDNYIQRVRGGEMGMLPALAGAGRAQPWCSGRPDPLLLHQDQHREPDDPDRGADDARGGVDVRDHPGRDRPVGRRHRRSGHGDLHPAHQPRRVELDRWRCSSRSSSAPRSALFIGFFVAR